MHTERSIRFGFKNCVCIARVSEEIDKRDTNSGTRDEALENTLEKCSGRLSARDVAMKNINKSSGNVFQNLELPGAEELQVKAELTRQVYNIIKKRGLTQVAAAKITGLKQPDVSRLMRGQLAGFSTDRLLELLNALDHDVEIVVTLKPRSRDYARVRVKAA